MIKTTYVAELARRTVCGLYMFSLCPVYLFVQNDDDNNQQIKLTLICECLVSVLTWPWPCEGLVMAWLALCPTWF